VHCRDSPAQIIECTAPEFCGHLAKPGNETVVLYADGKPVESLVSNGDLGGGGVHLCVMDMAAFGTSHGPVLEAGAGRRNALDRRATLASRAAGQHWRSRQLRFRHVCCSLRFTPNLAKWQKGCLVNIDHPASHPLAERFAECVHGLDVVAGGLR
jgi:hypothetical protein